MSNSSWNDSYSVGIIKIDTQHKRLFQLIDDLNNAMAEGKGKEIMGKVLNELVLYINTHFKSEEALMTEYGYPDYEFHKSEHEKYTQDVQKFHADYLAGKSVLSVQIMNFLRNWLVDHIAIKDKKLGAFLKDSGVK